MLGFQAHGAAAAGIATPHNAAATPVRHSDTAVAQFQPGTPPAYATGDFCDNRRHTLALPEPAPGRSP